ncbi:FAD-dependent oxidoreductase [Pseudonocardia humida]|uniref:FAD-dependent monooxygenase n=1 Tax=Pseudonocardia humida TaxID=2800819 RepID=A0ABT1AC21_9PSEU|nr:NAD(P)/FAD-dependent oxidoreductase [Pseudonocardia humida]MCO1660483.1 FAD-dependent monooxygenase [Pseudonocardia humida]
MSDVRTAIVIGGGIAGPVAAMALRRAGIAATVHEAYPGPADGIGGSLAIAPNGQAALGIVGAASAVDTGQPITSTAMSLGADSRVELPRLADLPPQRQTPRGDLHRTLHRIAAEQGVPIVHGSRLVGVEETRSGVTARFADGRAETADVLVGADGVHSTVRKLIDPDAPDAGYTGLLGLEGVSDHRVGEPGTMTFAFGRRAYYLYWSLADGRTGWGANLPRPVPMPFAEARAVPAEQWLRTLRETYADDDPGAALMDTALVETVQVAGALHIMPKVPHWHRGRMVLVGDAVHAPSNSSGQGASLAVESAIELARCLRDLPDVSSAFAAYEAARRPRVERIAAAAARINHAKAPGPVGRLMMRAVMPLATRYLVDPERTLGPQQRFTIDWDAPAPAS